MKNPDDDLETAVHSAGSLYAYLQRHRPELVTFPENPFPVHSCDRSTTEVSSYGTVKRKTANPDALAYIHAIAHGTTILALRYSEGVVVGSDTQVTAGHTITGYMNKVLDISSHSAIAISGSVGLAQDISDQLRVEVTYYERINHAKLSPQGTANTLGRMIKANFAAIQHGLVCIPILAFYDLRTGTGKVFSYDVIGTLFETDYQTGGSGGERALSTLEEKWTADLSKDDAVLLAVESLVDAARTDTATTAVDEENNIYPIVKIITRDGITNVSDEALKELYHTIRKNSPPKRKVRTRGT